MRWVAGRGVEVLPLEGEAAEATAALVEPGLDAPGLAARVAEVRAEVRGVWDEVIAAGTIAIISGEKTN